MSSRNIFRRVSPLMGSPARQSDWQSVKHDLARRFRELGFKFVTLDLEGFRSGSLNELVGLEIKARYQEAASQVPGGVP